MRGCLALLLTVLVLLPVLAGAGDLTALEYEKYTLPNGLQVILHEDHSIPMVSVNVWYHVGSKNEKPGRTGFAHLFEHMMFQGSEHHDSDYFLPLQKIGGQVNGSTNTDRTNYWQNVPSDQLELALYLESDRMGNLLPAMTQEKLDNQRDVVKNEKRQGENRPYAKSRQLLLDLMFPDDHPYSWSVIGSMEDLSAASKEDVSEFFRLYYAPNNASLCVAGDFDPAQAKQWIEQYFGAIEPGRPVDRLCEWLPVLDGERRALAEDTVELPRLYMQWHTPGRFRPGDAEFDLLADILASGKTSRLHRELVYERRIAQDVRAWQASRELGSTFGITVTAAPGHTLDEIEAVVDAELARLLDKGVTDDEIDLARTRYEAGFVRRLQRVGGFGGKADLLNLYNVFTGGPDYLEQDLGRYRAADAAAVNAYARRYLGVERRGVLHIVPQGTLAAADVAVDRTDLPGAHGEIAFTPPAIQTARLDNGLTLYLVEKHELPLVEVRVNLRGGWSCDPEGKPGTAALTADMLDEGVKGRDALQLAEAAERLGADLETDSSFDGSSVSLNVLRSRLEPGLDLLAEVVTRPTFPAAEFERLRESYLGRQRQESNQPQAQAIKEFQRRCFGDGHPYAQPYTGTGTPASLAALAVDDLAAFHAAWFRPNNAAVVVVGDVTLDEARGLVQKAFRDWRPADLPELPVVDAPAYEGPRVVVIDRPGAEQSYVVGGFASLARNDDDYLGFQVVNTAFGGQFASRINLNLREDKGYTYGVRSRLTAYRDGGYFMMTAPVQTDATAASVSELLREMRDIATTRPVAGSELDDSRNRLVMGFPQRFETYGAVAGSLGDLLLYDLPLDDWRTFPGRVAACDEAGLAEVAARRLRADRLLWIIVGDWEAIGEDIKALGLGEPEVVRPGRS
jgi:zinc protease